MAKTSAEYKELSIREFTKAAQIYDSGHAGIYEICKYDYPKILAELEGTEFTDLLDCGCGTGSMLEILCEKFPGRHYTGLDLTPEMIKKAKEKSLPNTEFLVGDCEALPFADESFDVIICTNSFHHYPNPQAFLDEAWRVLRKNGRLILRDYTSNDVVVWLINHIELPLCHLVGHGDVRTYRKKEYEEMFRKTRFSKFQMQPEKKFRCHVVAVK